MEGRWQLLIGRGQIIGYQTDSGNRMISNPSMDMRTVPVVPCDDAAVGRVAAALFPHIPSPYTDDEAERFARSLALMALGAAGRVADHERTQETG